MVKNFGVIGVGGYVAPRHLQAIKDTGNRVVAAVDPNDSVGILDQFSTEVDFFTEFERFDHHIEKLRRESEENWIHYISICSPNYLHNAHCHHALRAGADVICEKPLVIAPWHLNSLQDSERETGKRIYTVLQLRMHPKLLELREQLAQEPPDVVHDVVLTYVTARGNWYFYSWKSIDDKSGGLATNIGFHFFDALIWLFGDVQSQRVYHADKRRMAGFIQLKKARVRWFLSIDAADLPVKPSSPGKTAYRSLIMDGQEIEFTEGFTDLHTRIYREVLEGRGLGIEEVRRSVELAFQIRMAKVTPPDEMTHPAVKRWLDK